MLCSLPFECGSGDARLAALCNTDALSATQGLCNGTPRQLSSRYDNTTIGRCALNARSARAEMQLRSLLGVEGIS